MCVSVLWYVVWWFGAVTSIKCLPKIYEPSHDKTNKVTVCPAKTQYSLGIRPVWSESSLSAWRKLGSLVIYWAQREDSDQTGRMPRVIWVFAGRSAMLLVLSWGGSVMKRCGCCILITVFLKPFRLLRVHFIMPKYLLTECLVVVLPVTAV